MKHVEISNNMMYQYISFHIITLHNITLHYITYMCAGDEGEGYGQAEPVAADGQGRRGSGLSRQENESHAGKKVWCDKIRLSKIRYYMML